MSTEAGDQKLITPSTHIFGNGNGNGSKCSNDFLNSRSEYEKEQDIIISENVNNGECDDSMSPFIKYNNSTHLENINYDDEEEFAQINKTCAVNTVVEPNENIMATTVGAATATVQSMGFDGTFAEHMNSLTATSVNSFLHPMQASMISSTFSLHLGDETLNSTLTTADGAALLARFDSTAAQLIQQAVPHLAAAAGGTTTALDFSSLSATDTFGRLTESRSTLQTNLSTSFSSQSFTAGRRTNTVTNGNVDSSGSLKLGYSQPDGVYPVFTRAKPSGSSDISGFGHMGRGDENPSMLTAQDNSNCSTPLRLCGLSFERSSPTPPPPLSPTGDVDTETAEIITAFKAAARNDCMISSTALPETSIGFSDTFGTRAETVYSIASQSSTGKVFDITERTSHMGCTAFTKENDDEPIHGELDATLAPGTTMGEEAVAAAAATIVEENTCEEQQKEKKHNYSNNNNNNNKQNSASLLQPHPLTLISLSQPTVDSAGTRFMSFVSAMSRTGHESPTTTGTSESQTPSMSTTTPSGQPNIVDDNNAVSFASIVVPGSFMSDSIPKLSHTATLNAAELPLLDASRTYSSGGGGFNAEKAATSPVQISHLSRSNDGSGYNNNTGDGDNNPLKPGNENQIVDNASDQNQGSGDQNEGSGNQNEGSGDQNEGSDNQNQGSGDQNQGSGDQNEGSGDQNEGSGDQNEGSGDQNQGSDDQNEGSGNQNEGSDNQNQGSDNQNEGSGGQNQGSGDQNQGSDNQNEGSVNQNQGSGNQNQGSGNQNEASGDQNKGSGDQNEGSDNQNQGSGDQNEGSGNQNEGSGDQNQGSGNQNEGSGDQNQGSGDQNEGSDNQNQGSGDQNEGSGNQNQGSGDQNEGSGDQNQGSDDQNQGSDDQNQGSGNQNEGSGNQNQGSGDQNEGSGNQNEEEEEEEDQNEEDDDDDFGEFVEAAPSREAVENVPTAASTVAVPFDHSLEQQHELCLVHKKEDEGNPSASAHSPGACTAGNENVFEVRRKTVHFDENEPSIIEPLPEEVMNAYPEEYVIAEKNEGTDEDNEEEEDYDDDYDDDEEEWAAFTEVSSSLSVAPREVASTERGLTDNNVSVPMVSQAMAGDYSFVADGDIDKALLRQRLSELAGCMMISDCDSTSGSNVEGECNECINNFRDNDVQVAPSRSELLLSTMDALSFTRRAQYGATEEDFGCIGNSFVASDSFSASFNLLATYPTLPDICDAKDPNQQQQQQQTAAPVTVDPVAALQIADRRSLRSRENLDSLLQNAPQRQQQEVIPVETVIERVRSIAEDQELQPENSNGTTYHIHYTLPPPQIGGSVYPAPSLRLPI